MSNFESCLSALCVFLLQCGMTYQNMDVFFVDDLEKNPNKPKPETQKTNKKKPPAKLSSLPQSVGSVR